MPRGNRIGSDGGVFHVTQRCHNRQFLLKFARDRDAYRTRLREHLGKYNVWMLDYCLTCNHVHLLLETLDWQELSRFMQEVASEFARGYNRRKHRLNAVWGDNYHATAVESGRYLWECLCYIELNMVRCGVVAHPRQWAWVGYHELIGARKRYRMIDLDRLCQHLGTGSLDELRANLNVSLEDWIARDRVQRESYWTESLAIGSQGFVERMAPQVKWRQETETFKCSDDLWVLRESEVPYNPKRGRKSGANAI
jgi:putative transposase